MSFLATLRIALAALRVNKLRSALTMLGIIIGVGAVIAMTAIGAGAQARVEDQIKSLGSNLIIVLPGNFTSGGVRMGSGSQQTLSEDDALLMPREIPEIEVAAPQLRGRARSCSATATGRRRSSASRPTTWSRANGRSPRAASSRSPISTRPPRSR
jgi:putative ABC transport system permease protein